LKKVLVGEFGEERGVQVNPKQVEVVRRVHGGERVTSVVRRGHGVHERGQGPAKHVEKRIANRVLFRSAKRGVFQDVRHASVVRGCGSERDVEHVVPVVSPAVHPPRACFYVHQLRDRYGVLRYPFHGHHLERAVGEFLARDEGRDERHRGGHHGRRRVAANRRAALFRRRLHRVRRETRPQPRSNTSHPTEKKRSPTHASLGAVVRANQVPRARRGADLAGACGQRSPRTRHHSRKRRVSTVAESRSRGGCVGRVVRVDTMCWAKRRRALWVTCDVVYSVCDVAFPRDVQSSRGPRSGQLVWTRLTQVEPH
jgi:hypothetical protein